MGRCQRGENRRHQHERKQNKKWRKMAEGRTVQLPLKDARTTLKQRNSPVSISCSLRDGCEGEDVPPRPVYVGSAIILLYALPVAFVNGETRA